MNNISKNIHLNVLNNIFKVGFYLHLSLVLFLTGVNYLTLDDKDWELTARGNVSLTEHSWKPIHVHEKDRVGKSSIVLLKKSAFVRMDFHSIKLAFQSKAIWVIIADVLWLWAWLFISFFIWRILNSMKQNQLFEHLNIKRLQKIAVITGVIWLLEMLRNVWFAQLLNQNLEFTGHTFKSITPFEPINILFGIGPMLFILLISEVFRIGLQLKQENDLTV